MNPYEEIFEAFQETDIKYLIIGGVAVNLYGYNRFTGDIDILLTLDKENLEKMDKLMKKLGYVPRLPVEVKDLGDKKQVEQWMKEKNLKAYTFLAGKEYQLDIDIIIEQSTEFSELDKKKNIIEVWGMNIPVISIDDLIEMKKTANRDQDLIDIKRLLELKSL